MRNSPGQANSPSPPGERVGVRGKNNTGRTVNNVKWRLGDIIDLEYFLHRDAATEAAGQEEELHRRDRTVFLESIRPESGEGEIDRQSAIRGWLAWRRKEETAMPGREMLPGQGAEGVYGSFRKLFLLAGLLLGAVLAGSYLAYTGERPVNVFVFLAAFVFSQLLLLLALVILSLYRQTRRSLLPSSPLYLLISRSIVRLVLKARQQVSRRMSAEQRQQAEAALGVIVGRTRTHGLLFALPVFILTQLFAIGFNLGVLAATLFKVVTADIAFGWQSTIQLSPGAVHSLAADFALPWSWALPAGIAFPTPAQVEGSRIILKEGIQGLATPALVSWWPFLCLAVLVYGLLPRLILFLLATGMQHRALRKLDFRQARYEQLLLRMTTPLVSSHSRSVDEAGEREEEFAQSLATAGSVTGGRDLIVMVPQEIQDSCSREELETVLRQGEIHTVREIIRLPSEYDASRKLLADLQEREWNGLADILIIQEGWQPPIMEYIDFLRQLRKTVGETPCIRIALIGKPRPETVFTPVKDENRKIWGRKIAALGDPCMFSGALVADAS